MTEEQARLTREAWAAVRNFACANDPEHVVALAGAVDALLAAEPAVSLEEQLATAYHEGYERGLRDDELPILEDGKLLRVFLVPVMVAMKNG